MINIYVTHHVTAALDGINDILIEQLYRMRRRIRRLPDEEKVKVYVAYWTNDPRYGEDLRRRVPQGVEILFNDRPGRPDTQPSLRNKILDHAQGSDCEAFILLHNDVRIARGCLDHLIADWRKAERRYGKGQTLVSPYYIPYHLGTPRSEAMSNPAYWDRLRANPGVNSIDFMKSWCRKHDLEFKHEEVTCPERSSITDDGHQIMMFIAGRSYFDAVGPCDERYTGADFDDNDWGIKALMSGRRHLRSTGALIGHIASLSFKPLRETPEWLARASDNRKVFIDKWGQVVFDEMQTGEIWKRLHREQGK
jgi:hypothetical protein